jgi:hypothetical protein
MDGEAPLMKVSPGDFRTGAMGARRLEHGHGRPKFVK